MAKRILLMYISKVSGHRQATVAIEKAIKMHDPTVEVLSINGFGYTYPILETIMNRVYMGMIKMTPYVWEYLYDNQKFAKRFEGVKQHLHKSSHKKLDGLFKEFKPDVVVCTQAFPCGMAADYKIEHQQQFKVVGVLTDHAPHVYWVHQGIDYLIVPSHQATQRYLSQGYTAPQLKEFGIPIRSKFAQSLDRLAICQKLNLNPDIPTVLIMGGGQGLGPMKDAAKAILQFDRPIQLAVICGTNVKLVKWLHAMQRKSDKKILVYDYTTNVDELMTVASFIISKPGGLTTSECLAKGLPMLIIDPIPGQEERNSRFLVENGVAMRVMHKKQIGQCIEELLNQPVQLARMRQAALTFAKPNAADDIAKFVLSL